MNPSAARPRGRLRAMSWPQGLCLNCNPGFIGFADFLRKCFARFHVGEVFVS